MGSHNITWSTLYALPRWSVGTREALCTSFTLISTASMGSHNITWSTLYALPRGAWEREKRYVPALL